MGKLFKANNGTIKGFLKQIIFFGKHIAPNLEMLYDCTCVVQDVEWLMLENCKFCQVTIHYVSTITHSILNQLVVATPLKQKFMTTHDVIKNWNYIGLVDAIHGGCSL